MLERKQIDHYFYIQTFVEKTAISNGEPHVNRQSCRLPLQTWIDHRQLPVYCD